MDSAAKSPDETASSDRCILRQIFQTTFHKLFQLVPSNTLLLHRNQLAIFEQGFSLPPYRIVFSRLQLLVEPSEFADLSLLADQTFLG